MTISFPYHRIPLLALLTVSLLLGGCKTKGGKAFNEGQGHLRGGRHAKAIASFERAVRQNPDFGEAHYNLGAARYQRALELLRKAVKAHGSEALRQGLASTVPKKPAKKKPAKGKSVVKLAPEKSATAALRGELDKIPAAEADPIVALLAASLKAKLRARALFQKGKFVIVKKKRARRAMLAKLDRVARLQARLRKATRAQRGLWLLAVARPAMLTPAKGKSK